MADVFTQEKRSDIMKRVGPKGTKPECIIEVMLADLGVSFDMHRTDLPGNPDFVIPSNRTVVFVHGCFWHGHVCPRGKRPSSNKLFWRDKIEGNVRRDRRVNRALRANGWRVLTVWECRLKKRAAVRRRLERILSDE